MATETKWVAAKSATSGFWFIHTADAKYTVAECVGHRANYNARLIAAAPEMVEALKFYAERKHHVTTSTGFAVQYEPETPMVKKDSGAKARLALKAAGIET